MELFLLFNFFSFLKRENEPSPYRMTLFPQVVYPRTSLHDLNFKVHLLSGFSLGFTHERETHSLSLRIRDLY